MSNAKGETMEKHVIKLAYGQKEIRSRAAPEDLSEFYGSRSLLGDEQAGERTDINALWQPEPASDGTMKTL